MKKTNYIKLSLLLITIILFINGCKKNSKDLEIVEDKEYYETYQENELTLPAGVDYITDMATSSDTFRIACVDESRKNGTIWSSTDSGTSWNLEITYTDLLEIPENSSISARLSENSEDNRTTICIYNEEHIEYYTLDENNVFSELTIAKEVVSENQLRNLEYLGENWYIGVDADYTDILFNSETGDIRELFSNGNVLQSYEYLDSVLYAATLSTITPFDVDSGNEAETKELPSSFIEEFKKEDGYNFFGFSIISSKENSYDIFYADKNGLYKYWDNYWSKLSEGDKCSLGNLNYALIELSSLNKDTHFIHMDDEGHSRLFRYSFAENKTNIEHTIKIFSLTDNDFVKQVINIYQSQHPEIAIELEIGLGDSEFLTSDILNKINTELLAQNNIDIIFLDGLNTETYAANDILYDLSDTLSDIESEEQLITTVTHSFDNGGIYIIPTRFSLMNTITYDDEIDTNTDVIQLVNEIDQFAPSNKRLFEEWSFNTMSDVIYRSYFETKTYDTIETEQLKEFYTSLMTLSNHTDLNEFFTYPQKHLSNLDVIPYQFDNLDDVISGEVRVSIDYINSLASYMSIMKRSQNGTIHSNILKRDGKEIFVPHTLFGITKSSENIIESENFLKFLLSEEGQGAYNFYSGLSVNYNTLENELDNISDDSLAIEHNHEEDSDESLDEAEKDIFRTDIGALKTPCISNPEVKSIIMEQADLLLQKDISVDTAAQNASHKLKLYLAE